MSKSYGPKNDIGPLIPYHRLITLSLDFARIFTGRDPRYSLISRLEAIKYALRARREGHSENRISIPLDYEGRVIVTSYWTRDQ